MIVDAHDNPQDDPEAVLLSAILWSRDHGSVTTICQSLSREDFYTDSFGIVFATIKDQYEQGRPYNPASIRSALYAQGDSSGIAVGQIDSLISMLTGLEHLPGRVAHYAHQVASRSYRRQFRAMAEELNKRGQSFPESELYPTFVEEGKKQREKWEHYRDHYLFEQ
ncbi:DnaB-like helicase N-terminal domain-containing protein [Corynebacterium flavescens]|uniref:DnaB-like helicase N-terminal domain-containing protein n=1 Tax=Corynebacterium flavescens TaxID=28028 RepID=UPI003FD30FF0